jgi:hypothetical protein
MKTNMAKDYRVRTVKTVITEYSVIAADTEDPLKRWEDKMENIQSSLNVISRKKYVQRLVCQEIH